jgi:hypothetical protein
MPLSTTAEAEKAFTTYKNYLVHIDSCLGGVYGVGDDLITGLIQEVRSTKKFGSIQRQRIRGKEREATAKALTTWVRDRKPHEGQTPHPRADRPDDTRDDEATDS